VSKPRVQARLLELLNYGDFWAARLLLRGLHPRLGSEGEVRTSKLVRIDFEKGELETLNTVYEFCA
jgi:DNA polymerase III delta prime subunit